MVLIAYVGDLVMDCEGNFEKLDKESQSFTYCNLTIKVVSYSWFWVPV